MTRAWQLHAVVLLALAAAYLFISWDAWFSPPKQPLDLDGFGAAILLMVLSIHAFCTTLFVALFLRRAWTVALLHALVIAACVVAMAFDHADERERDAATARAQEGERQRERDVRSTEQCVRVVDVVVRAGRGLEADVTVHNDCPFAVVVNFVELTGTDRTGDEAPLRARDAGPIALAPGATAARTVTEFLPGVERGAGDGWSWRVVIGLAEPGPRNVCRVTAGAANRGRCGPLVDPRWQE